MYSKITWITEINNCNIGISEKPKGNELLSDEIIELKKSGIKLIISLLRPNEIEEFGLKQEENLCLKNGIDFINFPITDRSVPRIETFAQIIEKIYVKLPIYENILIHCKHGIGRSSLFACGLMINSGYYSKDAFELISKKRRFKTPDTNGQYKFSLHYEQFVKQSEGNIPLSV